jgi:hypothetical protein
MEYTIAMIFQAKGRNLRSFVFKAIALIVAFVGQYTADAVPSEQPGLWKKSDGGPRQTDRNSMEPSNCFHARGRANMSWCCAHNFSRVQLFT